MKTPILLALLALGCASYDGPLQGVIHPSTEPVAALERCETLPPSEISGCIKDHLRRLAVYTGSVIRIRRQSRKRIGFTEVRVVKHYGLYYYKDRWRSAEPHIRWRESTVHNEYWAPARYVINGLAFVGAATVIYIGVTLNNPQIVKIGASLL